jgi:hypothetical protein
MLRMDGADGVDGWLVQMDDGGSWVWWNVWNGWNGCGRVQKHAEGCMVGLSGWVGRMVWWWCCYGRVVEWVGDRTGKKSGDCVGLVADGIA